MSEDCRAWKFDPNTQMDLRPGVALEFIAYYLDRIDQHLEVIAQAAQSGGGSERLRLELRSIAQTLQRSSLSR